MFRKTAGYDIIINGEGPTIYINNEASKISVYFRKQSLDRQVPDESRATLIPRGDVELEMFGMA